MATDDRELARRFPSGDGKIVRAVYERYGRAVHTVAMSILHDRTEASDVVQATFLNAWKAAARFAPERELGPWLYAIARRQAIDVYRRHRRIDVSQGDDLDVIELPPSMERTWEAWQVRLALDKLPADEREVVRLSTFVGLTHPEIAERLGVPVGTVKSRSHRAHRRLAVMLAHLAGANRTGRTDVAVTEGGDGREGTSG